MKTFKLLIVSLLFASAFSSCGSDDDDDSKFSPVGRWIIKEVNYTSTIEAWPTTTYPNMMAIVGWSPYMFSLTAGYEFSNTVHTDDQTQHTGNVMTVVLNSEPVPIPEGKYWLWNETADGKSFTTTQLAGIPFSFALEEIKNIKEKRVNGKRSFSFEAKVPTIDMEKYADEKFPKRTIIKADAVITLEEVSEVDITNIPVIKLNGNKFELPTQAKKN